MLGNALKLNFFRLWVFVLLGAVAASVFCGPARAAESSVYHPWRMHHIRDDYKIANSLNAADVNQDGFKDYSVIDESLGLQTIIFHSGKDGDVRAEWPRVVLGKTGNPEYSCLGDLDGDGNLDLVVLEGDDAEKGHKTGIRIWWGPDPDDVMSPEKWTDAGHIPGSENQQYLYCEIHDIDGDGFSDILAGGRRNSMTKEYAGLRWLTGPRDPDRRRDTAMWTNTFIDPDALSGHGFVVMDLDQDGDADIALANPDWDTSEWDESVDWYENPGNQAEATRKPWPKHQIWRGMQLYPKPQLAVGDLDGDGRVDLATQSQNWINLFRNEGGSPPRFQSTRIKKPGNIQWIGRPLKFADLDNDGQLDIVGALIHNDGLLPADRASVFWLKTSGDPFDPLSWSTYPIKWSDGFNSYRQWRGEKWDHLLFTDVDSDGDIDIVGNVEEHFQEVQDRYESFFSVVWFENPLK